MNPSITIVSGGQTGADRGGLDAALSLALPHGGWCPKGRKAEDGLIPSCYLLRETPSASYLQRTEWNVRDSDATLIFTDGPLEGGSKKTADFAIKHKKPFLHLDISGFAPSSSMDSTGNGLVTRIVDWLSRLNPSPRSLNIAGQRASKAPTLQGRVTILLVAALKQLHIDRESP